MRPVRDGTGRGEVVCALAALAELRISNLLRLIMRLGGERERCAPAAGSWLVPVRRDGTPMETETMNEVPTNETRENASEPRHPGVPS